MTPTLSASPAPTSEAWRKSFSQTPIVKPRSENFDICCKCQNRFKFPQGVQVSQQKYLEMSQNSTSISHYVHYLLLHHQKYYKIIILTDTHWLADIFAKSLQFTTFHLFTGYQFYLGPWYFSVRIFMQVIVLCVLWKCYLPILNYFTNGLGCELCSKYCLSRTCLL